MTNLNRDIHLTEELFRFVVNSNSSFMPDHTTNRIIRIDLRFEHTTETKIDVFRSTPHISMSIFAVCCVYCRLHSHSVVRNLHDLNTQTFSSSKCTLCCMSSLCNIASLLTQHMQTACVDLMYLYLLYYIAGSYIREKSLLVTRSDKQFYLIYFTYNRFTNVINIDIVNE